MKVERQLCCALVLLCLVLGFASASRTYGITSLSTAGCVGRNNLDATIGDDRSGIAVTPTHVYHLGDEKMIVLNPYTLGDSVLHPIMDGIFSDLGDGSLWTLAVDRYTPLKSSDIHDVNTTITYLLPLLSTTWYDPDRRPIKLSIPLAAYEQSSSSTPPTIFAGVRGFVYVSAVVGPHPLAGVWHVHIPSGRVERIYPTGTALTEDGWTWSIEGSIRNSENWAQWGVMEESQGAITLAASGNMPSVRRGAGYGTAGIHRWSTNGTYLNTVLAEDIGDAAAITANYFQRNETFMRWYVHGEGSVTTFPGVTTSNEWLVSCPAVLFSNCGNGQVDAGEQCDNGKLDTSDGCNEFCDFGAASGANCALCDLLSSLW